MIRFCLGLGLAALAAAGLWWSHHTGYTSGIAACQALHASSEQQARTDRAARIAHAQSVQTHITHIGDLRVAAGIEASHETVQTIIRTVRETPAPAGCIAPAASLQALDQAVHRANAAAGALRVASASSTAPAAPVSIGAR